MSIALTEGEAAMRSRKRIQTMYRVVWVLLAVAMVGQLMYGVEQGESAPGYRVTTVDVPFANIDMSVTGLNSTGTWVGSFTDENSLTHGFMKPKNKPFLPPIPLLTITDLNRAGSTVGWYFSHMVQGFLFTKTAFTPIQCPLSPLTEAVGLNDQHLVVGDCFDEETDTFHSFLFDPHTGAFEIFDPPFDPPCWSGSGATDITNAGAIVGGCAESGYLRDEAGNFTVIHVPGSTLTLPRSINRHGEIAGITCTELICQCFLRAPNGQFTLMGPVLAASDPALAGAHQTDCSVLADDGRLGGSYLDAEGNRHGFVAHRNR